LDQKGLGPIQRYIPYPSVWTFPPSFVVI
jgi:hypothetical protein